MVDEFIKGVLNKLDLGDLERNVPWGGAPPGGSDVAGAWDRCNPGGFSCRECGDTGKGPARVAGPGDVGVVLGLEFLSKMGRSLDTAKYELLDENLGLRGGESEVRRVFEAHLWELAPYVSRSEVPCRERDPAFVGPLSDLSRFLFALFLISLGLFPSRGASAGLTQDFQVPFTPGLAFVGLFPAFDAESQTLAFLVQLLAVIPLAFLCVPVCAPWPGRALSGVLSRVLSWAWVEFLRPFSSRGFFLEASFLFVQALAAPTAAWLGWSLDTPRADS